MPLDFYRFVLLPLLLAGSVAAALAFLVLDRLPGRGRRLLFLLLVLAALAPYALHSLATVRYVQSFGPPASPPLGAYPGLRRFGVLAPLAIGAVWLLGVVAARLHPTLAAAAPLLMGLVYWRLLLPMIQSGAPDFVMIDNMPLVWLFAYSLVAALVLLAASVALVRPARAPNSAGGSAGGP